MTDDNSPPNIKKIQRWFDGKQSDGLVEFGKKVQELNALEQWVQESLPAPLQQHCRVANFRDGCLILKTDSPVWATKLRYQLPELLAKLRTIPQLCKLRSISHYVQPDDQQIQEEKKQVGNPLGNPHLKLSKENADLLNTVADSISDEKLKEALQRLANRRTQSIIEE